MAERAVYKNGEDHLDPGRDLDRFFGYRGADFYGFVHESVHGAGRTDIKVDPWFSGSSRKIVRLLIIKGMIASDEPPC